DNGLMRAGDPRSQGGRARRVNAGGGTDGRRVSDLCLVGTDRELGIGVGMRCSLSPSLLLWPFQCHACPGRINGEARCGQRLNACKQKAGAECWRTFHDENPTQRARIRYENRVLQREMLRALGPSRYTQPPALREMLAYGSDPGIDDSITNDLGD